MPSTLFTHCSRMFGKFTSSLLIGSGISRFPFLFFSFSFFIPANFGSTPPNHTFRRLECFGCGEVYFRPKLSSCLWLSGVKLYLWDIVSRQRRLYRVLFVTVACSSLLLLLCGTVRWFWTIFRCLLMQLTVPQFVLPCLLSRLTTLIIFQLNISSLVQGLFSPLWITLQSFWNVKTNQQYYLYIRLIMGAKCLLNVSKTCVSGVATSSLPAVINSFKYPNRTLKKINRLSISWMCSPLTLRLQTLLTPVNAVISSFTSSLPLLLLEQGICSKISDRLVVQCCIGRYPCWGIVLLAKF